MTLFFSSIFSILLTAAVSPTVTSVPAPGLQVNNISVNHAYVQQTKKTGDDAQAYFAIHNTGATADTLIAWACSNASTTVLAGPDGKPLQNLPIPAGQTVSLSLGASHLILQNNHFVIEHGSIVPCALKFQNQGQVQLLLYAIDERKS